MRHSVWLLTVACGGTCPPPEVVGTDDPALVYATTDAIRLFFDALPEEVCVQKVKVGSPRGNNGGWYRTVDRRIKIKPDGDPETARIHVTHELCHAADLQLSLRSIDHPEAWSIPPESKASYREGSRRERREGFAQICSMGPEGFALLRHTCPDDGPLVAATVAELAKVYAHVAEPSALMLESIASIRVGEATLSDAEVLSSNTLILIFEDQEPWFVDLWTAADADETEPIHDEDTPRFPVPQSWYSSQESGSQGSLAHYRGITGLRASRVQTAEGIGCVLPGAWTTNTNGELVLVEQDGSVVRWSRLVPAE